MTRTCSHGDSISWVAVPVLWSLLCHFSLAQRLVRVVIYNVIRK